MTEDITNMLHQAKSGEADAVSRLADAVYMELRQIAGAQMRRERAGHTLQPTELLNEAFLRLFQNQRVEWQNRSHFYAIAAMQMRRVLIEHGRLRNAAKRCGIHLEIKEAGAHSAPQLHSFGDVEALLDKLRASDPAAANVVELKVYAGLTDDEIAMTTGMTKRRIRTDWSFAKSWLAVRLRGATTKI